MARPKKVLKWLVVIGLVAGAGLYVIVRRSAADSPVVFKTGKIDRGPVEQIVTATGQLNAVVTVQVGSQVSGQILKLNADFNSKVNEGDIVALIDPTRFKATLEQNEAQYKTAVAAAARARVNNEQAKRDYDRAKELFDKGVMGAADLDAAKSKWDVTRVDQQSSDAQVAQARAQVTSARVDLERTIIKAPISGTVLQRAVDVGQTVAASLQAPTLFTIAQDLSKMEVRAAIDEADVGKLKEGLEARFTVDAYPGQEFLATIHQIRSNPNVQQNVVTYDAILRVDNPDQKLRPGMTANVRIVSQRRDNVLRVPNAALRFKPPADLVAAAPANQPGGPGGPGGPGATGDGGAPERRWQGGGGGGNWMARQGGGGGGQRPGGGMRGMGGGGPGGRSQAQVYRADGEKVVGIRFRPGIADDEYTEVLGGRLSQGDEVVVDATGGNIQSTSAAPRGGAGPMGGGAGRGRGPRLF
jgi:HlyD family secretion protein